MNMILHAIGNLPSKRAVLVSSNIQYAAGQLAETLDPYGVRVFREESVAHDWLFDPAERGRFQGQSGEVVIINVSGRSGGTGRRAGLKIPWGSNPVRVRFPPPAPTRAAR